VKANFAEAARQAGIAPENLTGLPLSNSQLHGIRQEPARAKGSSGFPYSTMRVSSERLSDENEVGGMSAPSPSTFIIFRDHCSSVKKAESIARHPQVKVPKREVVNTL